MKAFVVVCALFLLVEVSWADPLRSARGESAVASPILTSIISLETTADWGDVELVVAGLTATGARATRSEPRDSWIEEDHHLRYATDPRDGYWAACYRILLEEKGVSYIVGYKEEQGDSDDDFDDTIDSCTANVPFDFDLATQTFRIRTSELVPVPVRFRKRAWTGLRFLVPVNLHNVSKQEAEMIIQARGGKVVGGEGSGTEPVDVVVLPDRIDFCPGHVRSRNRLAEKWARKGAQVLCERFFGRTGSPLCNEEGELRD